MPTLRALLNVFSDHWVIREIEEAFIDAGIGAVAVSPSELEKISGQRRQAAWPYLRSIDLSKPNETYRLLPVFDAALERLAELRDSAEPTSNFARLRGRLQSDGFVVGADGRLRPKDNLVVPDLTTRDLDSSIIRQHLRRLEHGLDGDPALVIGSSKELIESVCKMVLKSAGVQFDDKREDLPGLVKKTLVELQLHPSSAKAGTDGKILQPVRQILGALSAITSGIIELRNEAGTGHGRGETAQLSGRHSHLVAGAAITFTRFILETFEDEQSPWRQREDE